MKSIVNVQWIVALAVSLCSITAAAADVYPTKPIRLVVPFAPGGGTDVLSRIVAQHLSETLGQQVIIDNKPGAGGAVGAEIVTKAPRDGYTLYVATTATAMMPSLYKNLAFDPIGDFAPIALIGSSPFVLIVNNAVPAKSLGELIALAKANPGTLSYGSAGNGSVNHVGMELFKTMAGVDLLHIPYKGSSAALSDVLGERLTMMLDTVVASMPNVKSNRVRALAVTSLKRSALAPELPTVSELGPAGFEVSPWYCIVAPTGTPDAIVRKLNAEINKVLSMPSVRERYASLGAEPTALSPEELGRLIRAEEKKWATVVKQANIRVD